MNLSEFGHAQHAAANRAQPVLTVLAERLGPHEALQQAAVLFGYRPLLVDKLYELTTAFEILPYAAALEQGCIPLRDENGKLLIATDNPWRTGFMAWADACLGPDFKVGLASPGDVAAVLSHLGDRMHAMGAVPANAMDGEPRPTVAGVEELTLRSIQADASPIVRLTNSTLYDAYKAGASYMNSQLIKMEALLGGFSEGIALDDRGYVSEGSGENIFLVNGGRLITPPLGASILPGITRDSVVQIAREMGIEVIETQVQRSALYLADEVFFTGTAAEITPIRSVDRITVGEGRRGEMTKRLQEEFFKIIAAERPAPFGAPWLTFVNAEDEKKTVTA